MEDEKVHLPMIKKTPTYGASPRGYGAPVARVLYYLNCDFGLSRGIACAIEPPMGAGLAQGGPPV